MQWEADASKCYHDILVILGDDGELTAESQAWLTARIEAFARQRRHKKVTFVDLDACMRALISESHGLIPHLRR